MYGGKRLIRLLLKLVVFSEREKKMFNPVALLRVAANPARSIACLLVLSGITTAASGYTECNVTPTSVFAGDEGTFYISYSNGGSSLVGTADPDFKQTVAMVMGAILGDKQIDVRYAADGVSCTATMQPLVGVRLYR